MNTIKLKVKLSAYTKGIIPNKISQLENDLNFISDVEDNNNYIRTKDQWVNLKDVTKEIITEEGSGINIIHKEENIYKIEARQKVITNINEAIEEDKTYYLLDENN